MKSDASNAHSDQAFMNKPSTIKKPNPARLYHNKCGNNEHWQQERESKRRQYNIQPRAVEPRDGLTKVASFFLVIVQQP